MVYQRWVRFGEGTLGQYSSSVLDRLQASGPARYTILVALPVVGNQSLLHINFAIDLIGV